MFPCSHVAKALKSLIKNVQTHEDEDLDEEEVGDMVSSTFYSLDSGILN